MNKLTPEHIQKIMDEAEYHIDHQIHGKVCVVVARLKHNGFTITGTGSCVDPANYSPEIGEEVAKENIKEQLWQLEGYLLQEKLFGDRFK